MEHLLFASFLFFAAFVFAKLEIQIEGPHGWAAKLPTWRVSNRWTELLYSSRPLTGYHVYLQLMIFVMVHFPVVLLPHAWSIGLECRIISFFILLFLLEDFLWFVLNPAYGIKRWSPAHIDWHAKTWWWIAPRDYWLFSAIGIAIYWIGITKL